MSSRYSYSRASYYGRNNGGYSSNPRVINNPATGDVYSKGPSPVVFDKTMIPTMASYLRNAGYTVTQPATIDKIIINDAYKPVQVNSLIYGTGYIEIPAETCIFILFKSKFVQDVIQFYGFKVDTPGYTFPTDNFDVFYYYMIPKSQVPSVFDVDIFVNGEKRYTEHCFYASYEDPTQNELGDVEFVSKTLTPDGPGLSK